MRANSDAALADISLSCGFYDQSYFTRVFKEHRGMKWNAAPVQAGLTAHRSVQAEGSVLLRRLAPWFARDRSRGFWSL